jgi:geranylgeranyl diphosphate synthase type II
MHPDVKTLLQSGAQLTDAALERLLPSPDTVPHSIHRAMRHSVFAGGKRLRPILCMEAARMVSGSTEIPAGAADLGAALEMIHTYSLIHDDLPALDNDDLRRGKPTCHVVFGEAIAILAGDALQTLAFQTIAQLPVAPATVVAILKEVSIAIGTGVGCVGDLNTGLPPGMIGGQVVDIESEGKAPTTELVESIHRAKTGALITTSIVSGGIFGLPHIDSSMGSGSGDEANTRAEVDRETGEIRAYVFKTVVESTEQVENDITQIALEQARELAPEVEVGGELRFYKDTTPLGRIAAARAKAIVEASQTARATHEDTITRLRTFGEKAGLAFQIVDDVLDVTQSSEELGKTAGKDTATTKATWPAVYGIDRSLKDAQELIADAFAALEPFGAAANPLKSLAQYLVERKN